jgi:hypothetical protein
MESLKVTWVSRSAPLIAEILPDIDQIWQELLQKWTLEEALEVCQFSVYCTDEDKKAQSFLVKELFKPSSISKALFTLVDPTLAS